MSSKRRSTETRNQILDATWELISQKGAEFSMAELARKVGVSRQAVYLYFGSRGGLLMGLVRRADERFRIFENFAEALAVIDPVERFRKSLDVWIDFVEQILPVARELIRLRAVDKEASAAWEDRMVDARQLFLELAHSLENDGALNSGLKVGQAAGILWASCSVQAWDLYMSDLAWEPKLSRRLLTETLERAVLSAL